MKASGPIALVIVAALAVTARAIPTATVTVDATRTELRLGQGPLNRATITVRALVEDAAGADDGIFTFDMALVLSDPSVARFVPASVERPGVHSLLGGSDGIPTPHGLDRIAGGFLRTDAGLLGPEVLFTADLIGLAPGTTTVAVGPDTDVYGVDLLLYASPAVDGVYDPSDPNDPTTRVLTIHVTGAQVVIPEPSGALLVAGALAAAGLAIGRRTPHRR